MTKPFYKRIKWDNILNLLIAILMVISIYVIIKPVFVDDTPEVEYQEYMIQEGDTIFTLVQKQNGYDTTGFDTRELVRLTREKNKIEDVTSLKEGQTILVPIIIKEE